MIEQINSHKKGASSQKLKKDTGNNNKNSDTFKHAFITGYNHDHRLIKQIMSKHWYVLKNDSYLEQVISDKPCIIYRRAKTLKNVLAPSHMRRSYKCKHKRCKCCLNISHDVSFIQSNTTKKVFYIRSHLDCSSINVIYVINCTCGLQYVSRTTQHLKVRMNNHRFNILSGYYKPSVSRHIPQRAQAQLSGLSPLLSGYH